MPNLASVAASQLNIRFAHISLRRNRLLTQPWLSSPVHFALLYADESAYNNGDNLYGHDHSATFPLNAILTLHAFLSGSFDWTKRLKLVKLCLVRTLSILLVTLLLAACENPAKPLSEPKQGVVIENKEIIVVTHNGPNTYYINGDNELAGLEHDLAMLFAESLGPNYSIKFLLVNNITKVIPTLLKGKAHLAAADLSITPARQHLVRFSVPYQSVQQQVVYNIEQKNKPGGLQDLIGKRIAVPAGTSYAERLREISKDEPLLGWQELGNASTDELLEQVAEGLLDYTVADDHLVALVQNYYPNLGTGLALGKPEKIAWAFPKTGDPWLYNQANVFFARIQKDGTLRNLLDRYYGHSERLDAIDVTTFLQRIRSILPQYIDLFKQAQEVTGLDWRLLAAISYRESHWDRFNTSPTNVRGMMMLTENTADSLGVTDRLDAKQSIMGGARYIIKLRETIPERVQEPDRTWMALAAYNIGYAHVEDARVLAERLNLNPDSWADIKKTLPLLNRAEYYTHARYGYANGGAPVIFVESVRTYHKILEKFEPQHSPLLPNFKLALLNARANLKSLTY
ncbi:MAG TPA: membrane-bound lytic murein transglycosylase MltF [Methylophilaceae bacterium]|nr:membrane-bound lytic murein transglycosylase MltF [Methylophilaceae bacterium]